MRKFLMQASNAPVYDAAKTIDMFNTGFTLTTTNYGDQTVTGNFTFKTGYMYKATCRRFYESNGTYSDPYYIYGVIKNNKLWLHIDEEVEISISTTSSTSCAVHTYILIYPKFQIQKLEGFKHPDLGKILCKKGEQYITSNFMNLSKEIKGEYYSYGDNPSPRKYERGLFFREVSLEDANDDLYYQLQYSTDGINWLNTNLTYDWREDGFKDVWCRNGHWVLVTYQDLYHSTDGINWTVSKHHNDKGGYSAHVYWSNNIWVAATHNWVGYSTNGGVSWTTSLSHTQGQYDIGVSTRPVFANGKWVMDGFDDYFRFHYSSDGKSWTLTGQVETSSSSGVYSPCFIEGYWYGTISSNYRSADGVNWSAISVHDDYCRTPYIYHAGVFITDGLYGGTTLVWKDAPGSGSSYTSLSTYDISGTGGFLYNSSNKTYVSILDGNFESSAWQSYTGETGMPNMKLQTDAYQYYGIMGSYHYFGESVDKLIPGYKINTK